MNKEDSNVARVLGRIRQSVEQDTGDSDGRQREHIQRWADDEGHTIIGWAIDIGVSGSLSPWATPQFGDWLNHRADEFDIIAASKLDRLSRRLLHSFSLLEWAKENSKLLKAVNDPLDPMSKAGSLIFMIMAWLAEGELEAIADRNKDNHAYMVRNGFYRGGSPPFGYKAIPLPHPTKPGKTVKRLVPNPDEVPIVNRMVEDILTGWISPGDVADWLNKTGVKPRQAKRWIANTVREYLKSPIIIGQYRTRDGKIYRDPETGLPFQRAEPIVERTTWLALQEAFKARSSGPLKKRTRVTPLNGVLICLVCGQSMYYHNSSSTTRGQVYYRCRSHNEKRTKCANKAVPADWAHEAVESLLLGGFGDTPMYRTVSLPAEDHTEEISQTEQALDDLTADRAAGLYKGESGTARFRKMYANLEDRLEHLRALPNRPARREAIETGRTVREEWESKDWFERGELLLNAGIRAYFQDLSPGYGSKIPQIFLSGEEWGPNLQVLTGGTAEEVKAAQPAFIEVVPGATRPQISHALLFANGDERVPNDVAMDLLKDLHEKLHGDPDS